MSNLVVKIKQEAPVKYLLADMAVRYWEDAKVNGVEEDDDAPKIPFKNGGTWSIKIDMETGKILDWPQGVTAETHYKVCDAGIYTLVNSEGDVVLKKDGYVPSMLSPSGSGYGDYVIMKIGGNGQIENWSVDLSDFEEQDD